MIIMKVFFPSIIKLWTKLSEDVKEKLFHFQSLKQSWGVTNSCEHFNFGSRKENSEK